jgi:hypothetical protein
MKRQQRREIQSITQKYDIENSSLLHKIRDMDRKY